MDYFLSSVFIGLPIALHLATVKENIDPRFKTLPLLASHKTLAQFVTVNKVPMKKLIELECFMHLATNTRPTYDDLIDATKLKIRIERFLTTPETNTIINQMYFNMNQSIM